MSGDPAYIYATDAKKKELLPGHAALHRWLAMASGAVWVSLHHGGVAGMGFNQHAGMVIVADRTADAVRRLERVLWNDPATGVMRHADAGYPEAVERAREQGLTLPSLA